MPVETQSETQTATSREAAFDFFRRWGYLQASLDPLGQFFPPEPFPVEAPAGPDADLARSYYSSSIGAEFMHIASPEKRAWIEEQLEKNYTAPDPARILTGLIRADGAAVVAAGFFGISAFGR